MLLKLFAAVSATATALNVILVGVEGGVIKTVGFTLLRFIEYYVAAAILYLAGAYAVTELTIDLDKPQDVPSKFWQWKFGKVAEMVRQASNIKLEVTGCEKLPKDSRYLLVSNHRSLFDPVTMADVFKKEKFIYISKPTNFKIPIAGKIMHKCSCMPLNREDNREALKTIIRAANYISDDVASVVIYPEGTRNKNDALLPFHAGSFKIAKKAGVPVVVVAMMNTDTVSHNMPFKRTTVKIDVLDVIDSEFVKNHNTAEIAELAQSIIQERLDIERRNKEASR